MLRNLLVTAQAYMKPSKLWISPTWLGLEITTSCNSNCRTCPHDNYSTGLSKNRKLSFNDFKSIYNKVNPYILSLTGGGENFLNPEYIEMIKYASKRGALVYSTTNGLLLKKFAEEIIDSGLNELIVSLDGYDQKTYFDIRRIDAFHIVLEGIDKLSALIKKQNSNLIIGFNVVIQENNYSHLCKLIDIAYNNGVSLINFLPIDTHFNLIDNHEYVAGINHDILKISIHEAHEHARKMKVSTNLKFWQKHFELLWKKIQISRNSILTDKICHLPWSSIFINSKGDVFPCCGLITDKIDFGNIFEKSLMSTLNSGKALKFRDALKKKQKPFIRCKGCLIVPFQEMILDMARRKLLYQ